jgi:hypothetical protein
MSEDNKILQFPSHKVKKSKNGSGDSSDGTFGQVHPSSRKMILLVSLFSTVIFASVLSNRMSERFNSMEDALTGRNPASVNSTALRRKDFSEEVKLARKIAAESLRQPASSGRKPSAVEVFQHGLLDSVYSVKVNDQMHLLSVDFSGEKGDEKYLDNRKQFLIENSELLGISYNEVKLDESMTGSESRYEVYNLIHNDKLAARVHFTLTDKDKFISMKVESLDN